MAKTAVGLFKNLDLANVVVRGLVAGGLPSKDIRVLGEPVDMAGGGVMSIPHTDFEVDLARELKTIGAAEADTRAYVQGVRRGGVMVFATGSREMADAAVVLMNRHNAMNVEELNAMELHLPGTDGDDATPVPGEPIQVGRVRSNGSGARLFTW